ncbi:S9 family peptidase [Pontibacter burrus]|uniref:Prolyl oligopeptidase family serine peptidase n=1 Tax=Pontibacter burrus TaxID=2704466 RepID=A0A6B3LW49_9BACT|nr:S9 family peptidase [Pontibacter burrus]NEM97717.1 prolyl oligopeptidase family serine peptidase [Pontibacter burrus]
MSSLAPANNSLVPVKFLTRSALLLFIAFLLIPDFVRGQGSKEDYKRAYALPEKIKGKMWYAPTSFNWLEKEAKFWYMHQTPRGKEFVLVDADRKNRKPLFQQEKLAKLLQSASGKQVAPYDLPFSTVTVLPGAKEVEFVFDGKVWGYTLSSNQLKEKRAAEVRESGTWNWRFNSEAEGKSVRSPDKKWEALTKGYNVFIRSTTNPKEEYQLSYDGTETDYYSANIAWSPDSKKLATNKVRPGREHLIYFVEAAPADQLQPKLHSRNYLKPGDAVPQRKPQLFLVDSRKQIEVDAATITDQYHLTNPVWRKDSRAFTVEYNQRGHQVYNVLEIDAQNGNVRNVIEESSKTFIHYSGKYFRYDVADGKEVIWMSERDGWNHLYLFDGATGKVKNQITKGEWVVRRVVQVDEAKRKIIFEGNGREADQDPYLVQYYSINFDGSGLTTLTSENAYHRGTFSSDYKYFVDTYSRVDLPPVTVLRNTADGSVLMELEKGDVTELLKTGWQAPEVFSAKGRDGKTDIWGVIIRPSNFDPTKKYPVIEHIYAGPHNSFVPKTYNPAASLMHEVAELGFIVVQIDGMGTSNRSKAFHDVAWKNLKDAGFLDRIPWIKHAAEKYTYMDTTRVGIFGMSAGGQSSMGALLFHPEFYKVAVSSVGCHDNRMDKIWWNEQWMGKLGPHYADCSNVVNAHKLQGKLLLVAGELDDNVDPASTTQVVDALIKANKNFDYLMVPGMAHGTGGDFGERKRRDFFVKHLLGVDPPEWESMQNTAAVQ